jgi:hypothetical protein
LFNRQCLSQPEIILCEAVFDALTFYANGFQNVTCLFGTEGFTAELWEAILKHKVQRVRIAYDADEAGERAAQRDAERFRQHGIEVFRIKFPWGMDANQYASKVKVLAEGQSANKSLALLLNSAAWIGKGSAGQTGPAPNMPVALRDSPTASPSNSRREEAQTSVPAAAEDSRATNASAPSSLAAGVSGSRKEAAKKESAGAGPPEPPPSSASPPKALESAGPQVDQPLFTSLEPPLVAALLAAGVEAAKPQTAATSSKASLLKTENSKLNTPLLEQRGDAWFMELEGREYRVAGLEKTLGTDSLKITLRLRVVGQGSALFHLDQVDLCRDSERRRFVERAAQETGLTVELLKRDLGKLLLAVEQAQADLAQPQEQTSPVVTLSPEEREQALALLGDPKLLERILAGFEQCGLVGEATNKLVGYLAAVSRKLDEPLAVLIQSTSTAGKSSLMEAILAFVPEEERVKYSAMTGQSLYYLGDLELRHKVREFTGWGNTQLKLHLGRLEEMEYLLAHRGRRGQSFVYELIYDGQGKDGQPFLAFAQLLRDHPGRPFQRPQNLPDLVRRARVETGLPDHPAHPGGLSALAVALHQGQRPTAGLEHPARAPGHAQGLLPLAHQAKRHPPQPGQRA